LQFAGNLSKWNRPISSRDKVIVAIKLLFFGKTYWPLKKMYKAKNAQILGLLYAPLPIIDASDILISPFKIEHFSRPAVEAFAYGKPVIGSDVEGMDEIVDHGLNGLLVKKTILKPWPQRLTICAVIQKKQEKWD
jgi:glycosyltransferase involved in cell wall biosynthesis